MNEGERMKERTRCKWVNVKSDIYVAYHDEEWGIPVRDDAKLYEMLLLECFQAGLSWLVILKKREAFRLAFDGFDAEKVSEYGDDKIDALLLNADIVRSRGKIAAAISNTRVFLAIQREFGSFSSYLWGFTQGTAVANEDGLIQTRTELSDRISADLKKRGMKYAGSVTIYSYLQAVGVVNDHEPCCFRFIPPVRTDTCPEAGASGNQETACHSR